MSRKVTLPVQKIQHFLDAVTPWFRKCIDYRNGLELCLVAESANSLHVSVGGTAFYAEAVIQHPDVSNLAQPIFLDLDFLIKFKFKEETMQITIPDRNAKVADRRVQFRGQSVSFKIPIHPGEKWETHQQRNVRLDDLPGFVLTGKFLTEHYKRLLLPNSFSVQDSRLLQLTMSDRNGVLIYSSDSYGAFCHEFPDTDIFPLTEDVRPVKIFYDFLLPYKGILKNKAVRALELRVDGNQSYGSIQFEEEGFERFVWVQPQDPRMIENIPQILGEARKGVDWSMEFNTAELNQKLNEVTSFYSAGNFQADPIAFSIVADQYTLSTVLQNSEMSVQGKAIRPTDRSVRANFPAGCLIDYITCLEQSQQTNVELLRSSAILYQSSAENQTDFCYWMPIRDR